MKTFILVFMSIFLSAKADCPIHQEFRFSRQINNTRLLTNKTRTLYDVTERQCEMQCVQTPACESYNYHTQQNTCEYNIHIITSVSAGGRQVITNNGDGWKYRQKEFIRVNVSYFNTCITQIYFNKANFVFCWLYLQTDE